MLIDKDVLNTKCINLKLQSALKEETKKIEF